VVAIPAHLGVAVLLLLPTARCLAEVRGGARVGNRILSWGDGVRSHDPVTGEVRVLLDGARFGEGGCAFDGGLVLHEVAAGARLGTMAWLEPGRRPSIIDTDADFSGCLAATLFGRRGVLLVHRGTQVRFYMPPADRTARWSYREIYSIYTPSSQAGLLLADIDRDGADDIVSGNYWIQAPARFQLPWRLFAINNWWEGERSATLVWAAAGESLVAAEREASPARVSVFERPADVKQFWLERKLKAPRGIHRPQALLAADLDRDGKPEIYVGENRGPGSRLLEFNAGVRELMTTGGILELWEASGDLWILGRQGASVWRPQRRK
jgi:hypothetical protein